MATVQNMIDFESPPIAVGQGAHRNSRTAYHGLTEQLRPREQAIVAALKARGPMTDRQLAERLGFADLNAIRPRCNRLLQIEVIEEAGDVVCDVTGKRVRTVKVKHGDS